MRPFAFIAAAAPLVLALPAPVPAPQLVERQLVNIVNGVTNVITSAVPAVVFVATSAVPAVVSTSAVSSPSAVPVVDSDPDCDPAPVAAHPLPQGTSKYPIAT
jgi:hypothetical protein